MLYLGALCNGFVQSSPDPPLLGSLAGAPDPSLLSSAHHSKLCGHPSQAVALCLHSDTEPRPLSPLAH